MMSQIDLVITASIKMRGGFYKTLIANFHQMPTELIL